VGNSVTISETIAGEVAGVTNYDYDSLDRITQVTQIGNGVTDKRVDFSYDPLGQFEAITRNIKTNGAFVIQPSSDLIKLTKAPNEPPHRL